MTTILLHGLGQGPESWERTAAALAGPVLCPSLPALLSGGPATYQHLYQALCAYCDPLPGPLNLCGLSLGGVLALDYAIHHPDRLSALALIAAQHTMPRTLLRFQGRVFRLLPERAFREMGLGKADVLRLTASMEDLNLQGFLSALRCPVLVVCGSRDRPNRRAAEELAAAIPGAELHILEGAGHQVNLDAPQALGALLAPFFARR